ncbi:HEPN/Toprim-associated domain-containing protein [Paraburkholderia domus]|uniref:HEPN/Toprim N-terminal domain-containing protein n=1 Tax=Paraburkholderia domus TaxID=2793075 RepID=A0A9N8MMJ4_9BURK|nr:HEPN/Toprim-associated domain-containing protein [Paraburkholderia domus]MBK5164803.1 hypothetical protein [Burkholderia sp. R-70211]CAE6872564.1 hypothetical protein R70211_01372 [Paraburkholderia domus]
MDRPFSTITINGYTLKTTMDCYRRWRFTREDRTVQDKSTPEYLYVTSAKVMRQRLARAGYDRTTLELDFLKYLRDAFKAGEMPYYCRDDVCGGKYTAREQAAAFRAATLDDWLFALKAYITSRWSYSNTSCKTVDSPSRYVDANILIGLIARDDFIFDRYIELQHDVRSFPCANLDNMAVAMLEVLPESAEFVLDVSALVNNNRAYSFDDLILALGQEKAAAHFARIKAASERVH